MLRFGHSWVLWYKLEVLVNSVDHNQEEKEKKKKKWSLQYGSINSMSYE